MDKLNIEENIALNFTISPHQIPNIKLSLLNLSELIAIEISLSWHILTAQDLSEENIPHLQIHSVFRFSCFLNVRLEFSLFLHFGNPFAIAIILFCYSC